MGRVGIMAVAIVRWAAPHRRALCTTAMLIFALHQLLMASGWHAEMVQASEQTAHHTQPDSTSADLLGGAVVGIDELQQPRPNELPLGDCRIELAVFPFALLLALFAISIALAPLRTLLLRRCVLHVSPLRAAWLSAGQRRAFLQVFLI